MYTDHLSHTPLSGRYEQSKDYIVSAELSSSWIEKYSNRYGFVGLAFNMEDARNYDIAYVRYLFLLLPASYTDAIVIELPLRTSGSYSSFLPLPLP